MESRDPGLADAVAQLHHRYGVLTPWQYRGSNRVPENADWWAAAAIGLTSRCLGRLASHAARYYIIASGWVARASDAAGGDRKLVWQRQKGFEADLGAPPSATDVVDPAWRTSTVLALAQGAYEDSDFSALPILADALQDAGCDSDDVLSHCRDEKQVHVRGCWVIDLLLGKA